MLQLFVFHQNYIWVKWCCRGITFSLSHAWSLGAIQSSYRSQDQPYKQLLLCIKSYGRKHKLSPAAERKLVRMVKSQPKTTTKESLQWIKSCWKTGVSVHSQCVLHQQELRGCCTYRSSRSRWSTLKLQWSLLPIIWKNWRNWRNSG